MDLAWRATRFLARCSSRARAHCHHPSQRHHCHGLFPNWPHSDVDGLEKHPLLLWHFSTPTPLPHPPMNLYIWNRGRIIMCLTIPSRSSRSPLDISAGCRKRRRHTYTPCCWESSAPNGSGVPMSSPKALMPWALSCRLGPSLWWLTCTKRPPPLNRLWRCLMCC